LLGQAFCALQYIISASIIQNKTPFPSYNIIVGGNMAIKIHEHKTEHLHIVEFIISNTTYYLAKSASLCENVFDINDADLKDARTLWGYLIERDYEPIHELDNIANGTNEMVDNENYSYKIKHKDTGLYSTGGMRPRWMKDGNVFSSLKGLKLHLGKLKNSCEYKNACIIVLKECSEMEISEI
jgi:hypothetical protein